MSYCIGLCCHKSAHFNLGLVWLGHSGTGTTEWDQNWHWIGYSFRCKMSEQSQWFESKTFISLELQCLLSSDILIAWQQERSQKSSGCCDLFVGESIDLWCPSDVVNCRKIDLCHLDLLIKVAIEFWSWNLQSIELWFQELSYTHDSGSRTMNRVCP